jgi:hypothetical protein
MESPDIQTEPVSASFLALEALLDGEPVHRGALSEALADEAGREHFLDLLVLRGGMAALGPEAWTAPRQAVRFRGRWWAAAAIVALSVATGFVAGQRTVDAVSVGAVETVVEGSGPVVAPKPTRVIRLETGVNWTESTGGR